METFKLKNPSRKNFESKEHCDSCGTEMGKVVFPNKVETFHGQYVCPLF